MELKRPRRVGQVRNQSLASKVVLHTDRPVSDQEVAILRSWIIVGIRSVYFFFLTQWYAMQQIALATWACSRFYFFVFVFCFFIGYCIAGFFFVFLVIWYAILLDGMMMNCTFYCSLLFFLHFITVLSFKGIPMSTSFVASLFECQLNVMRWLKRIQQTEQCQWYFLWCARRENWSSLLPTATQRMTMWEV